MISQKQIISLVVISLIYTLIGSCSGSDDTSDYPKTVSVTYKISTTSGSAKGDVRYINKTGGLTTNENTALPYYKSFSREVKLGELLRLSGTFDETKDITMSITIDGAVVKDQTFISDSNVIGVVMYQFQ